VSKKLLVTAPVLCFKVEKFGEDGTLNRIGQFDIHKEINFKELMHSDTISVHKEIFENEETDENGYNY